MRDNVKKSIDTIHILAREYKNPIIYTGFGKDSIALLHLCRSAGYNWPIMYHRDSHFPKKAAWANFMIELWNLVTYDYPPLSCSIFWKNNTFEVAREYQAVTDFLILCALLYEPESFIPGEYLCALKDIYLMPKGTRQFPWDLGLQGHRALECKPHGDNKPNQLKWMLKHTIRGGPDWVQPLREWTNQEVYQYIKENDIPVNTKVYDEKDGEFVPKEDPTYNPDRRPACFRCMLPSDSPSVVCPKTNLIVNNTWAGLKKTVMPNDFPQYSEFNK